MGDWTDYSEPAYFWLDRMLLAVGFSALVLFWVAVFTRKGSPRHVLCGRMYVVGVYAVAAAALVGLAYRFGVPLGPEQLEASGSLDHQHEMAAVNQSMRLFLTYLALIAVIHARHGVRVMRTHLTPESINTALDRGLAYGLILAGAGIGVLGLVDGARLRLLLLVFSPLGLAIAWDILSYLRNPRKTPMNWWYAHMDAMLSSGITLHTAFAVVGAGRLFGLTLGSEWDQLPWLLPAAVGVPAIKMWKRRYKREFGELPPKRAPQLGGSRVAMRSADGPAINANNLASDK